MFYFNIFSSFIPSFISIIQSMLILPFHSFSIIFLLILEIGDLIKCQKNKILLYFIVLVTGSIFVRCQSSVSTFLVVFTYISSIYSSFYFKQFVNCCYVCCYKNSVTSIDYCWFYCVSTCFEIVLNKPEQLWWLALKSTSYQIRASVLFIFKIGVYIIYIHIYMVGKVASKKQNLNKMFIRLAVKSNGCWF